MDGSVVVDNSNFLCFTSVTLVQSFNEHSRNLMNSSEFVFKVEICHSTNPFEVIDPMIFTNCEYPTLLIFEDTPVGSQE